MDCSFGSKPMSCFEVQKVIGISDHGTYRVQWAPAWVSKFHLVGCEHLIQEFLQQQVETVNESEHNTQTLSPKPTEPSYDLLIGPSHNEQAELEINSTSSQESMEESHFHGKESNDSSDKLIIYSQQYSQPETCYDVKPDIYTDMDQGATEQSLSLEEDSTHQFESPEEPILDTVLVKLEPNEEIEGEMSASNDFNTRYEPVETHDSVSTINPLILNERTNSESVDYASPLHAEMYEANLQSFPDEMYSKTGDLDIDRESQTCSKTITSDNSNSKLELHHGIHTGFKLYSCPHCSYTTAQESTLTSHITTHSSRKAYACDVCQKTFARPELLRLHKRTHNIFIEKPYTCSTCSKSFAQSSTLEQHLLTHSKEKPHKCEQCGKCFTDKSHLKVHSRTYTGEKPYSCQTCGKAFASSSNMNRHNLHCTSASTRKENS